MSEGNGGRGFSSGSAIPGSEVPLGLGMSHSDTHSQGFPQGLSFRQGVPKGYLIIAFVSAVPEADHLKWSCLLGYSSLALGLQPLYIVLLAL